MNTFNKYPHKYNKTHHMPVVGQIDKNLKKGVYHG